MDVQISRDDAARFLTGLDSDSLARLAADLLAAHGHTDIKIVDGPGDGGRDIHSVDKAGIRHLAQCKYHRNVEQASGSREVGELPLALVKLGYSQGLFVTNARVSPQVKREFLDDYSSLDLDFMEGKDLVSAVLATAVVRALWFDGASIEEVATVAIVQCSTRDLSSDRNIDVLDSHGSNWEQALEVDGNAFEVRAVSRKISIDSLAPYRSPSVRTTSEAWWPGLRGVELLISGPLRVAALEKLLAEAENALGDMAAVEHSTDQLAIRFGSPALAPLGGNEAGARLTLDYEPTTLILREADVVTEYDWLMPSDTAGWYPPSRLSALIADWVRWYHHDADVCLDLQVLSEPGPYSKGSIEEQKAFVEKYWAQSVFCLAAPDTVESFASVEVPAPTETYDWYDGRVLSVWLHGNLGEGFRPLLVEPERVQEGTDQQGWQDPFGVDPQAYEQVRSSLIASLERLGVEKVDPNRARHMMALVSYDPIPSTEKILYRSVDLITSYHDIPSPILPSSRRVFFEVVWEVTHGAISEDAIKNWIALATSLQTEFGLDLFFDNDARGKTFLFARITFLDGVGTATTDEVLARIVVDLAEYLANLESLLGDAGVTMRRATREYWTLKIGVLFHDPAMSVS